MQPAARIASLIELLAEVEASIEAQSAPTDIIVGNFFRARRYAGSKDRRFISDMLYQIIRQREFLRWCAVKLETEATARFLVLTFLIQADENVVALFGADGPYMPETLTEDETSQLEALKALDMADAPDAVRFNVPSWAMAGLQARYGNNWQEAAQALNQQAPVDLRLNKLKCKSEPRESFHNHGIVLENTPLSPIGLRSQKNIALGSIDDYKRGLLEVQDEAAQLASLLVDAQPGMQVVDLCAGAGGKALTVAAQMENKGQLYAFDTNQKRLDACKKRAQRSGTRNIQVAKLPLDETGRATALSHLLGECDRVYVDVPCSGTGTWRRSPDQRWRHSAESLTELTRVQSALLREAAELVKPGGRLIYMTCSVLPEECEGILSKFCDVTDKWKLVDYKEIWASAVGTNPPDTLSNIAGTLQLSPEKHQADGFFVGVFERL